ncbi:class I SAM-dependent methyltransferase [bacterium]|nr:class I SAM-dependent methyltransferase [bacterium]
MSGPFESTAHIYDAVYWQLDYGDHATTIEEVIRSRRPDAASVLDVACGTGKHIEIFGRSFEYAAGTDIDPGMLAVAAERLPHADLHEADFTDFDLGRRFDAVTCLFSSIGYAATVDDLCSAVASMARHLEPGGVLVIEPWLQPHLLLEGNRLFSDVSEVPGTTVMRTSRWLNRETAVDEGVSRLEFAYLVTTEGGSEMFIEQHVMGLFTPDQYTRSIEAAGLSAEFLEPGTHLGRGLAVGTAT